MGYIPEHKIDEVRDAANIVDVVSNYVNLARNGSVFRGLCPFHAEKTPSFTVNPERRIFHCFGCGVGGNVFRFLMLQKGISFPEAVSELADRYGIAMPRFEAGPGPKDKGLKSAVYEAVATAQTFFEQELAGSSGGEARAYLEKRGLGSDIIRQYRIGWAPAGWDNLSRFLESKRVTEEVMVKAGLVKPRTSGRGFYDTFRARVITPIFDLDGRTVAFGGRLLQEEERQPKYLNSPETPIYSKGRILYGLEKNRTFIRDRRSVLIVEGYFDLLSLAAHGVHHVVATLGTALTSAHLRLLKGYVADAVLVFDADDAGRSAAARTLPLFMSADIDARVLSLPAGHDPDTFVREFGPRALEEAIGGAKGLLDFYLDRTLARFPDTLAGKSQAAQEVLGVLSRVEGEARVDLLRRRLAERLDISEEALRLSQRRSGGAGRQEALLIRERTADFETDVLRLILLHPVAAGDLFAADLGSLFKDAGMRQAYEALAAQFLTSGRVDLDRLEDLEVDTFDRLTGLALSDDGLDETDVPQAVVDYIDKFTRRRREVEARELSRQIKRAQAQGDQSHLEILLREKNRLLREQKC